MKGGQRCGSVSRSFKTHSKAGTMKKSAMNRVARLKPTVRAIADQYEQVGPSWVGTSAHSEPV